MFMITTLIKQRMLKLILNHLIGNNCPDFLNGLLDSYFFKLNLGSDCLELCFLEVPFKTILVQKYYKNSLTLKYDEICYGQQNKYPKLFNYERA